MIEPESPGFEWIEADWPAPSPVRAGTTTRGGGISRPPFDRLNLADHVGDRDDAVTTNRLRLGRILALPSQPCWLAQKHGCRVVRVDTTHDREADAGWTTTPGVVCAVLTADCLPLLLCDRAGTRVAAVHVGWRGIAAGIIPAALTAFDRTGSLLAWLGPAIGPAAFEVGPEVLEACCASIANAETCFTPGRPDRWLADLPGLTRLSLQQTGVDACHASGLCTHSDARRFYSYRRDGTTGRMASLIWIDLGKETN